MKKGRVKDFIPYSTERFLIDIAQEHRGKAAGLYVPISIDEKVFTEDAGGCRRRHNTGAYGWHLYSEPPFLYCSPEERFVEEELDPCFLRCVAGELDGFTVFLGREKLPRVIMAWF